MHRHSSWRRLALAAVLVTAAGLAALATTAPPASAGTFTLILTAPPAPPQIGQPMVLQAAGAMPPEDVSYPYYLIVAALPGDVMPTCPAATGTPSRSRTASAAGHRPEPPDPPGPHGRVVEPDRHHAVAAGLVPHLRVRRRRREHDTGDRHPPAHRAGCGGPAGERRAAARGAGGQDGDVPAGPLERGADALRVRVAGGRRAAAWRDGPHAAGRASAGGPCAPLSRDGDERGGSAAAVSRAVRAAQ